MRRIRINDEALGSFDNVWAAYLEARRGKRRKPAVAAFALADGARIDALARSLRAGQWRPRGYRCKVIRVPKPRLIAAAPFRDRVVHHALHRVIAPPLISRFSDQSYACLPGRGSHRCVLDFQAGLRRFPWMVRVDMRSYFLEIRWHRLLKVLHRQLKGRGAFQLIERVLESGDGLYASRPLLEALGLQDRYTPESGKGLPIGNLTSQLFANLYLSDLDHYAQRTLRVAAYARYLDDLVCFARTRAEAAAQAAAVVEWCDRERALFAKVKGGGPLPTCGHHRFLGYTVSRESRAVSGPTQRRIRARVASAIRGGLSPEAAEQLGERWVLQLRALTL